MAKNFWFTIYLGEMYIFEINVKCRIFYNLFTVFRIHDIFVTDPRIRTSGLWLTDLVRDLLFSSVTF
jgi:hypothetical protein